MSEIERQRVEEKIRVSYLRNGGNIFEVVDEVGLPHEYVEKIISKFQKQSKKDVASLISDQVMEHLLLGYHGRVSHIRDMIKKLGTEEKQLRSSCHHSRVRKLDLPEDFQKDNIKYECLECGELADTYLFIDEKYMSLKLSALDVLRKEDEALTKLCEKMGYTRKADLPPAPIIKQNIVVVGGRTEVDQDVVKSLEQLDPVEQESLRSEIVQKIAEAEIIDATTNESK